VERLQSSAFKQCTKCGFAWPARASFLGDPGLRLIGYQTNFDELMAGLFLFNHICGTTFSVQAGDFQDLCSGPIFTERLNGTEKCEGYCLHKDDLRPCPAKCECAYVREIVQSILKWPKSETDACLPPSR
jgi:hypothetical protein